MILNKYLSIDTITHCQTQPEVMVDNTLFAIRNEQRTNSKQAGFSMLEMLIGVAIGLIALVTIFQMLVSSETRKRTTSSGSDAQIAGAIALFNLERDARLSGMGFGVAPANIMGCSVAASYAGTAVTPAVRLYPIEIIQGTTGAPDRIISLYGNSSFLTASQTFTASTDFTKKTQTRNGFQMGDAVIVAGNATAAAGSANCDLVQVTSNTASDGLTFQHSAGSYTNFYTGASATAVFNIAAGTGATYTGGTLFNLGNSPRRTLWQITGGSVLTSTDTLSGGSAVEVAEGIVNLQAQYGVDSDDNGLITDGTGTPATPNEWVTATPTDWTKVRAIRVALLARSRAYEREQVTTTVPTWQAGAFTMFNLDGSAQATSPTNAFDNWRNYRYRVYEKVIPLRNMIWGAS
jgi:type IV pilus assembly protein PilW